MMIRLWSLFYCFMSLPALLPLVADRLWQREHTHKFIYARDQIILHMYVTRARALLDKLGGSSAEFQLAAEAQI